MKTAIVIALVAAISACDGKKAARDLPRASDNYPANYATEFRLKDGTRCVMTGSYSGGITCDWEGGRK